MRKSRTGVTGTASGAVAVGAVGAVCALFASGCALGPDFERPEAPTAIGYAAPVGAAPRTSDPIAPQMAPATPEGSPPAAWWTVYDSATLDDWVSEGLAGNADLKAAQATLAAAREQLRAQLGASTLPNAAFTGEVAHDRALGLPEFGPPTSIYKVYVGVLTVNYDIDLFGGIRRANEASRARVEMQAFELEAARQTIAANIVAMAIRSAALNEEVEATVRLVQLAHEEEELTERRYAAGAVPHRDVLDAMRRYQNAAAGLPGLRAEWSRTRHALAVLLGRTPETAPSDLDFDRLTLPQTIPVEVPSELVQSRPDIRAAESELHAATARVGVATANLYPALSLTGTWGSESFTRGEFLRSPTTVWGIAAGLTQPLFAGGALHAQKRAATDELEAARQRYRATVLRAFQNVADALRTLAEDGHAANERASAVVSARGFFDQTRARRELGAETTLAVVASEEAWQEERVHQIESVSAELVDSAALYQAIGAPVLPR